MRVTLWGTRGSVPAPTPATARYGGDTPCLEVRADDGQRLILDAGIGLHWLGQKLAREGSVDDGDDAHLLLTHTHWGHIQGLPFFLPMLAPDRRFTICGDGGDASLRERLMAQMEAAYCPVPNFLRDDIGAGLSVTDLAADTLDGGHFEIGDTRITPRRVNHVPGVPCVGYRVESGDASMAYIPDVEYLEAGHRRPALELAAGVDLLVHDAHFCADEYDAHRGQGHCSDHDAVALAHDAGAARLALFHHHPDRGDDRLDAIVAGHAGNGLPVEAAAQGTEYVLHES